MLKHFIIFIYFKYRRYILCSTTLYIAVDVLASPGVENIAITNFVYWKYVHLIKSYTFWIGSSCYFLI